MAQVTSQPQPGLFKLRAIIGHRGRASTLIVAALLGLQVALSLIGMQFNSPTVDEPAHIARGYHYVVTGKLSLDVSPPLMNALSAVPLLLYRGIIIPPADPLHGFLVTDFADKFVWVYNDARTIVNSARLMTVLLAAVLGYFVFRWARDLWGAGAGLLALFLYVLDPSILAHSQLATTDLGVACFIFMASFFLWRFLCRRQNVDLLLAGVLLGVAQACKFSALILIPIFAIVVLCEALVIRDYTLRGRWPWQGRFASKGWSKATYFICAVLLLVFGLSFLSLWASYRFEMTPLMSQSLRAFVDRIISQPSLRDALESHMVPLSSYVRGLRWVQRRSERTTPSFLLGRYSNNGWWHYVLVAIAVKTPVPTLVLLAIVACGALRSLTKGEAPRRRSGAHRREYMLFLPIVGFLLASIVLYPLQLGYRHVLPILPFMFVLCGAIIQPLVPRGLSRQRSRAGHAALALLALWYVATGVMRVYPHCLAYFNELAGGPDAGYQYLVGSDLDWGQDLENLKVYMEQMNLDEIRLAYYGSAHPEYYGIRALPLVEPSNGAEPASFYAISATHLQGSQLQDPDAFSWLREHTPVDKVGYSIFVYQLE